MPLSSQRAALFSIGLTFFREKKWIQDNVYKGKTFLLYMQMFFYVYKHVFSYS